MRYLLIIFSLVSFIFSEVIIELGMVNYTDETIEILIYNLSEDVQGFEIDIEGVNLTGGYGGLAEDAGFDIYVGGDTVLGFSLLGDVIPAGSSGVLTVLEGNIFGNVCLPFVQDVGPEDDTPVIADDDGHSIDVSVGEGLCECDSGVYDCAGNCDGDVVIDCNGDCGGDAVEDCLGECNGDAVEDCTGDCGGDAIVDDCGVCDGNNADKDCTGECFGLAVEDCTGECNGDAYIDDCEICDDNIDNDNETCTGCTDDTAENYDQDATISCDDGCCDYSPLEFDLLTPSNETLIIFNGIDYNALFINFSWEESFDLNDGDEVTYSIMIKNQNTDQVELMLEDFTQQALPVPLSFIIDDPVSCEDVIYIWEVIAQDDSEGEYATVCNEIFEFTLRFESEWYGCGDINNDGDINIFDIIIMINYILNSDYNESADINGDGILNVADCVLLVNFILAN
tara:strand:- start:720 stop:2078 length:1359 start_codon:yes stop_codon:yes gene_type:complete